MAEYVIYDFTKNGVIIVSQVFIFNFEFENLKLLDFICK